MLFRSLLNPIIETELRFGTTKSYGIETLIMKEEGRIRGMLGYTLSRVTSEFSNLNNGQAFTANSDRPHYGSLNLTYDVSLRFSVSTNFIDSSGIPFSNPTSF